MSGYRFFKWLNLPFADKALEDQFIDYYVSGSIRVSQTLMIIGTFAYYISFISDQVMDPSTAYENHLIRGVVAVPIMLICSVFLFFDRFRKYYEIIALIYYAISQIVVLYIFSNINKGFEYVALGLILLLMGTNLTFTVRLRYTFMISFFALISTVFSELYINNITQEWVKLNLNYMITAIIFSSISAHLRERAARRRFMTKRAIVDAQTRVDDLLNSMLPRQIAQRMRAGETSIADSLGEVTIIFANVSGLSDPAKTLKPIDRVRGLNRLFSLFDGEAERFGVEKVKTIGGSYMAIAGLSANSVSGDHAENTANFALAIQSIVRKWNSTLGVNIHFRIGIHVGPIVAGVIGLQRPRFDCWGDSVNIASRLESCAASGEIIISESTYWRLKQKFDVAYIDDLDLKGVGVTSAYQLIGRTEDDANISGDYKTVLILQATQK